MKDLRFYIVNTFNSEDISMNELLAGATDHLGRLSARNTGGQRVFGVGQHFSIFWSP